MFPHILWKGQSLITRSAFRIQIETVSQQLVVTVASVSENLSALKNAAVWKSSGGDGGIAQLPDSEGGRAQKAKEIAT